MQNPKQEVKNNLRTRLEAIEHYSRDEKSIKIGMASSLGDFYFSGFSKTPNLETTYHFIKKVTSRPEKWKHIIKYLKKTYP